MISQAFSQRVHQVDKSHFGSLRLYIEQMVSNASLQQLVETIQKSDETCFYPFVIPIRLDKCYELSDSFAEFIVHQQRLATMFAQQIIYKNVKSLCNHSNQIAIRFIYDKLPPRPEFRVLGDTKQADLLSRTHPVRLSGTVIASSAILPYIRGLKYECHSEMCPLNNRKRQTFVLFDVENPNRCKVGETILCDGCDLFLNEDINKRWISEKLIISIKVKGPETPILSTFCNFESDPSLSNTHTVIIRDEYVHNIRLGNKYNCICYPIHDSTSNRVVFEALHCEEIRPRRFTLPESILNLHQNFAHHHPLSFLNVLSTLFCPHIQLGKHCTHVKIGLVLSLVASPLHVLIVGNESRVADILCRTALKYTQYGVIHRQQQPLTLAPISKNKHQALIVTTGSIALGNDGITYLECIDKLSKSQMKQLHSAFETKTLSIEVNKNEETSKIVYTTPFNSNIWAYHDSRLWMNADQVKEPTSDLPPGLVSAFSLILPLDEIENEYEETIDSYLDSMLNDDHQQGELIDQQTSQWIDDVRSFLAYVRTMEMPLSVDAEFLLKKYFCACRRTKRTLFAYTELPATTTDILTNVCVAVARCNAHTEATESDMVLAIYLLEISTMTRLGCENLVSERYRSPPVLTDPVLIDAIEQRMISFSQELAAFCNNYTPISTQHRQSYEQYPSSFQ